MCGITGWVDTNKDLSKHHTIIENMTSLLTPRGPDSEGIWISNHALIGHRRLIVVDPKGGSQPMIRHRGESKFILTYNGELYNTKELRKELISKGHIFLSTSDTEVLLESYIEWGPSCVEFLNGIYAFAVWDEASQNLFMARDRFGVKPLFYTVNNSSIIFASELKSVLAHPNVMAEVAADGLAEIFSLGPARTPGCGVFKDIYELKPAHFLIYNKNGLKIRRYWALESNPHTDTLDNTIENVRTLLKDSIERQLIADVPICTFLSGGLDSSAITAFAAKIFEEKNVRLHTYSIDYVDNDKFFKSSSFQPNQDSDFIGDVSKYFNTEHHYINFNTDEIVDALKDALIAKDLPGMADIESSLLLFCREVKKNAVVALSGECADEIFGGYPWFHREELMNSNTFPWSQSIDERLKLMSPDIINYCKPHEYSQIKYAESLEQVPRLFGENLIESRRREIFYLNIMWFMSTLLDRKDRMSMATGLEVRVPFCDHRLAQYVWNIPWEMKMFGGNEKGILRKALENLLPSKVLYRKKSPYPKTHNPLYEETVKRLLLNTLNDNSSPILHLINKPFILDLINTVSDYSKPWFGQLMAAPQMFAYLISIDMWMRKFKIHIV